MPLSLSGYVNWSQIWESCRQVSRLQQLRPGILSLSTAQLSFLCSELTCKGFQPHPSFSGWIPSGEGWAVSGVKGLTQTGWGHWMLVLWLSTLPPENLPWHMLSYCPRALAAVRALLPCRLYKQLKSQSLTLRGITSEKTNNTCERRWKGEADTCVKNLYALHFHSSCWLHL